MKSQQTIFECKNCRRNLLLTFRKPTLLSATTFNKPCENCGTNYEFSIKIKPGTRSKGLLVQAKRDKEFLSGEARTLSSTDGSVAGEVTK